MNAWILAALALAVLAGVGFLLGPVLLLHRWLWIFLRGRWYRFP